DSAQERAKAISASMGERKARLLNYSVFMADMLRTKRKLQSGHPDGQKELAEIGMSAPQLDAEIEKGILQFRTRSAEAYIDILGVYVMVQVEYKGADFAFKKFAKKVVALQNSKKTVDRIAGLAAEKARQEEMALRALDNVRNSNTPRAENLINPAQAAANARDTVQDEVEKAAQFMALSMSTDIYNPDVFASRALKI
ncbi:MAG: hypothetical protein ACRCXM_04280, partial [Beijerinckiaceae bacterium]